MVKSEGIIVEKKMDNPKIQFVKPRISSHKFQDTILDKKVIFQITKLSGSLLIYIHQADLPCCRNLEMAAKTRFSDNPNTVSLLGGTTDGAGYNLAGKLAKRLDKIVYLSLNVDDGRFLIPAVEKRLISEIGQAPDKF